MKGLLLKEYYVMKRYNRTYLLYLVLFGGAGIFTGSMTMYSVMAVLFMTSIPLSSFSADETCKWDKMAISAPLSRRQIVASKYLMMLVCGFLSVTSVAVAVGIGSLFHVGNADFLERLVSISASIGLMAIMMMVLLPILFKVGAEKARMMMLLIFGGSFMVIILAALLLEKAGILGYASQAAKGSVIFGVVVVMPLAVLLAAFISYKVSCAIYEKREL